MAPSSRHPAYPGHARFLPYLLNRATDRLNLGFQGELRRRRMTLTHWRVLAFLTETDGLGVSTLAERTDTDQSTLSRALQQMERRGQVERRARTGDSRYVEIHLTASGRALFNQMLPDALDYERNALANLSPAEKDALRSLLLRLLEPAKS
ncbi:MAG: MarR family transcriptional regulator [Rhodospirillales bacterium]|nr:MarR family transcriptional regulator [Rhodospirillales bacterium]